MRAKSRTESADPDGSLRVLEDRTGVVAGQPLAGGDGDGMAVEELVQPALGAYPQAALGVFIERVDCALRKAGLGSIALEFAFAEAAEAVVSADPQSPVLALGERQNRIAGQPVG